MIVKVDELKTKLINLTKKNIILRKFARKLINFKNGIRYKLRGIGTKVDEKTILFYSFKGKSYSCSPKAIYEQMLKSDEYRDFKYIWAFENPQKYEKLKQNQNTSIVKFGAKEYEKALLIAKYWIVNYKIADHIYPKKEQIYLQCWHGTPLKKLGYDLKGTLNAMNSEKEIYDKYRIDAKKFKYIISPSKFTTEKFASAWNLNKTGMLNKILEIGYPRNDYLINYNVEDVKKIKDKLNIPLDKKIILYAPTWRDDEHDSKIGYTYKLGVDFEKLKEELEEEYIILFRAHYLVANSFDFDKYKNFIYDVSQIDDINELYIVSDLLITDYSSVFFDYANLKRPIIFHMYDFEKYKNELRGFYIDINELPGKITKTEQELINTIKQHINFKYDEKYQKFNQKFNHLDDGQVSKKVVKLLLNERKGNLN